MPILCSHCDLLIGPSRKKSLIPKVPEKWCAKARAIPYQGDLRHFLLRLSELPRQHGRATRWLADNPVPVHGKRDGAGFLRLSLSFNNGKDSVHCT